MKVRSAQSYSISLIWIVFIIILLGFFMLASELWQLQVKKSDAFEELFQAQSLRRVRLPAVRGKIYDTKHRTLADSTPNYAIAIYTHELRAPRSALANTLELIHEIWSRIGHPPDLSYPEIKHHMETQPETPLTLYDALNEDQMRRWRTAFESWTAPQKGSFRRTRIAGLKLGRPTEGNALVIQTSELIARRTSPAANTLALIYDISERIGLPRQIRFQDIKNHIYARRPLPLIAWDHLSPEILARWADRCSSLSGTDIVCLSDRNYPYGATTSHLIGYTLLSEAADSPTSEERIHYHLRELDGKKGLERTYNRLLSGQAGYQLMQIDAAGFHHQLLTTTPAVSGGDLRLCIDAEIQKIAAKALGFKQNGESAGPVRGAVVILDPNNGDVLAMSSAPDFDPNAYMRESTYRQQLMQDEHARTFHRAVFGQYPPGSTFKPITALAALREDNAFEQTCFTCNGRHKTDGRIMRCWTHSSGDHHGHINLQEALMHSCNIYMYKMAEEIDYAPIYALAKEFGVGQYAGLYPDLSAPAPLATNAYGNLPQKSYNDIDLCNLSIGQGRLLTSPLQMAMVTAAIANGGTLYRPRLVKEYRHHADTPYIINPTWATRKIDMEATHLDLIRAGMRDVIMHPQGTAKEARVRGVEIAGKTGSAQYRKRVGDQVEDQVYAWMISYAPFDAPRYAVAMIVEDGVSGGKTIGPRLQQLYTSLFAYERASQGGEL